MSSIEERNYNQAMVWSGIYYISIASVYCIFPMVADLFNGLHTRKHFIPSKYFSINFLSIIAISVVMKLPMDLYGPTPNWEGQVTTLGSMAFMSTMMVNMMPSLTKLDNKRLVVYSIGFVILVVTVIVDGCIMLKAGVIRHVKLAYIQVALLVFLLLLLTAVIIAVPSVTNLSDSKYQATCQRILEDEDPRGRYSIENLRPYLIRYRIMAAVGPEFAMAYSYTGSSGGLLCVIVVVIYILMAVEVLMIDHEIKSGSGYMWSVVAIVKTQSIGIVVGSIAPIWRSLRVILPNLNENLFALLAATKVERYYWTHLLYEWRQDE